MPGLSRHPGRRKLTPVRERQPCVYILASGRNGTLYVGVTSNLVGRVMQHRAGAFGGFTKRYGVHRLVWYDIADSMEGAIAAEKRIKKWPRRFKLNVIEERNPIWRDLAVEIGLPPLDPAGGGL